MINGVRVKVCGLTSVLDADAAGAAGADYLGFILYPKSPRHITLAAYQEMLPKLPALKKVGVVVYSSMEELEQYKDAGFDYIQLHFPNDTPFFEVAMWTEIISPHHLWLAPRVRPGKDLDPAFCPLADHMLVDTFHPEAHGGTGKTGNWSEFARLRERFTRVTWVLAGGLTPENVSEALGVTGAQIVDVNSGIEVSPGVKDHARLKAFMDAVREATVKSV